MARRPPIDIAALRVCTVGAPKPVSAWIGKFVELFADEIAGAHPDLLPRIQAVPDSTPKKKERQGG